jgi:hypothetical protein
MEDAMILNKSSFERGFAHGTVYKTEVYCMRCMCLACIVLLCELLVFPLLTFDFSPAAG